MSGETGYEKPEYLGMLWEGASGRNGEWEPRGGAGWGVRALLMERRGGGAGEEMQATGLVAVVLGKWHFLRESSSEII